MGGIVALGSGGLYGSGGNVVLRQNPRLTTNVCAPLPHPAPMLTAILATAALACPQDHDTTASPFDGLRWEGGEPEVLVEDTWYEPVAIDELAVKDILAKCDQVWPGQRAKRFGEDLVEVMVLMGWEGDLSVDLDVLTLEGGQAVRLEGVRMTRDKRNAIRDGARGKAPVRTAPVRLSAQQASAEIDAFEAGLRERFAYLSLKGIDLDEALEPVRESVQEDMPVTDLAAALHEVLMRFGDGHASVRGGGGDSSYYLPFLLADGDGGTVAFHSNRRELVNKQRPFVTHIDGRPLEDWIAAVAPRIPAGSDQLVRSWSLRGLREIELAREALGLPTGGPLEVTFAKAKGKSRKVQEVELSTSRPTYGPWPRSRSEVLKGNLGYLRIDRMDDDVESLRRAMATFENTRGLVVDVRGNGGGSRDLLLALGGYLIGPDEPAVVGNVGAYRLCQDFDEDHLEARFMYRDGWSGWSERQQAAIDAFAPSFEPEWRPTESMSAWHYLVLDHTGHEAEYFYSEPVVLLQDAGCFSATDIFLGALGELPRVTLMGTASAGGSARSQSFRLPLTGLEVRCASMASFRPDGRLYDGRGIEVDVEVLPEPEDFLQGGDDAQLDAAIKRLKR